MPYLIHHFLEESADENPSKEAVVHNQHRCTYLEIENRSNQIANWLIDTGLIKGDRVAVLYRNSVDYIVFYYGILKAGCIAVPLNSSLDPIDLALMVNDCCPRVLITESYFWHIAQKVSGLLTHKIDTILVGNEQYFSEISDSNTCVMYSDICQEVSKERPPEKCGRSDLSTVVYSSGSTGTPKGVMLSHLNIVANTNSITSYLPIESDDRCMVVLPFHYVYGKSLLNTSFSVSSTVVIDNRFAFPNAVLKTMIDEKVTSFSGVPSTYSILLTRSQFPNMEFPNIRYFTQAGGHLFSKYRNELIERFPRIPLFIMYGATEASARLAYLEPEQLSTRVNSCGKAIPNVEMKVVTEDGSPAATGQQGEILARGQNIMSGYWNSPDETDRVLQDGWYFTGDLGYRDEDGYFYLTGRARDMIKVGAYKVSAFEVEGALTNCPGVVEAAVVAVPDDNLGEKVCAFVVCETDTTISSDEVLAHCSNHLPDYKVPASIQFLDDMPRNAAGKIMKNQLPGNMTFD